MFLYRLLFGCAFVLFALVSYGQGSGDCLRFNGSNEYVRVNHNSSLNLTNTWTIEFWINPDVTPSGWDALISKDVNDRAVSVWLYYTSVEVWYGSGTSGLIAYTNYTTISAGSWQHVAVTRNSSGTVRIYVNGVLEATQNSTSTPPTNSSRLNFAQRGDGYYYYDGYMDDVRYWNVERSQTEIRENMCKELAGTETGLVAYWKLNDGSGGNAADAAGSNNGSLRNTPTWGTSGAPIGNSATSLFTGSWSGQSVYHKSADGDSLRVSNVTGSPDGIVVYSVDGNPNSTTGTSGLGANDTYFGVYKSNGTSPTYTMTYYYGNNTAFKTGAEESDLRIYQRTNNSITSWSAVSATLNTTANTLTATGLNSEFILGSAGFPLSVELMKFEGRATPYGNELNWVTTSEVNCDYYEIERSLDGQNWEGFKTVKGAGTTNKKTAYTVVDQEMGDLVYYRLSQYDFDGQSTNFDIEKIERHQPNSSLRNVSVYPTLATDWLTVESDVDAAVVIRTSDGKVAYESTIKEGKEQIDITDLPEGNYYLFHTSNQTETSIGTKSIKFVKIASR